MDLHKVKDLLAQNSAVNALARCYLFPASSVINYRTHGRLFYVRIDINNDCNLRCKMCPSIEVIDRRNYKRKDMSTYLFQKIADMVFPHTQRLQLGEVFEPLFHPRIRQILAIIGKYRIPFLSLVTNATLLTPDIAELILETCFTCIDVSIDAVDKESYESIRRGARFDKVVANIRNFIAMRDSLGKHSTNLQINHVLMVSTIDRLEEFSEFCVELGAANVVFIHVKPYTENPEYLGVQQKRFNIYRQRAIRVLEQAGVTYFMPPPFSCNEAIQKESSIEPNRSSQNICCAPWHLLEINSRGELFPCAPRTAEAAYGNLNIHSLDRVWNNLRYLKLRSDLFFNHPRTICVNCQAHEEPSFETILRISNRGFSRIFTDGRTA